MTREELKAAMSDLYAYAFADGRKSVGTVRDEDAGDHCTLGFESWFEYVYAPIRLTPTLTLDPATDTRIVVDVSRRDGMTVRHFGTPDAGGTEYRFPKRDRLPAECNAGWNADTDEFHCTDHECDSPSECVYAVKSLDGPKGLHGPIGFYDLPDGVTPEMAMDEHLKTCNQCRYERGMELLPNGLTKEEIETMRAWFDK